MKLQSALGAAAAIPMPVVWNLFGLGYRFEAGPFVVSITMVLITRLCIFLNTRSRRQIYLDIAVTFLCCVVAVLWTQAHSLGLLAAAMSAMTIAGIGYGLIGIGKSQFMAAARGGMDSFFKGMAGATTPETDEQAIDRLKSDLDKVE